MTTPRTVDATELALQLAEARQAGDWERAYRIRSQMHATLKAERDELLALVTRLLTHWTTKPHCGHTYTCVCQQNDIDALRALVARLEAK